MDKTVFFYRHGETDLNRERIVQGSGVDASINNLGIAQAKAFYDYYKDVGFEVVLTSKLRRTHQTVEPFVKAGLPWEQFEDINEISWGDHEGQKTQPWMHDTYLTMKEEWRKGNFHARIPNGESAFELSQRVSRFVDHLKERPEKNILVCSHGRTMRCLMVTLKEEPLHKMEEYKHKNTGLYVAHFKNNRFEIGQANDVSHLEAANLDITDFY